MLPTPNTRSASLADLERRSVEPGPFATGTQAWVQRIAMVPLDSLDAEDLLVLLGRQRGVKYLLPHALRRLETSPFAAGSHRAGELLIVVSALPDEAYDEVPEARDWMRAVVQEATRRIGEAPDAERERLREELEAARERFGG